VITEQSRLQQIDAIKVERQEEQAKQERLELLARLEKEQAQVEAERSRQLAHGFAVDSVKRDLSGLYNTKESDAGTTWRGDCEAVIRLLAVLASEYNVHDKGIRKAVKRATTGARQAGDPGDGFSAVAQERARIWKEAGGHDSRLCIFPTHLLDDPHLGEMARRALDLITGGRAFYDPSDPGNVAMYLKG
jgi:hypothetical protein